MLLCNSKSLTKHLVLLIHGDGLLRLFSSQEALLSLGEVVLLLVRLSLLKLNTSYTLRMVLTSNLDGRVPVSLMLVHVDGFLRLVGLDELFLSFLEPVVIFKV